MDHAPGAATGERRRWHPYVSPEGDEVVKQELLCVMRTAPSGGQVTTTELEVRVAEFRALVGEAERGQLSLDDWKSIARNPRLWELRLELPAMVGSPVLVRGYFAEPDERPDRTVLMLLHEKDVSSGDSATIARDQDRWIDRATARLHIGKVHRWGLDQSPPLLGRSS